MLMTTSTEQKTYFLETVFDFLINNTSDIEKTISLIVLIGGMVLTILSGVINLFSIMSTYSVEIAFMTKKEQWKHKIISILFIAFVIWILYVTYGLLSLVSTITNERIYLEIITLLVLFLVGAAFLNISMWIHESLNRIHLYRMICLALEKIVIIFQNMVKKCIACFKSISIKFSTYIKKYRVVKFVIAISDKPIKFISELWKDSEKKEDLSIPIKYTLKEKINIVVFMDVLLLGLMLNSYWAIFEKEEYDLILVSILLTILTVEILLLFVNFTEFGKAKIYYFDLELEKEIFIFFRYSDKYCLAGNKSKMEECDEYYMISYETVQKRSLYLTSKKLYKKYYTNYKNIVIQANEREMIIDNILNEVANKLEENKIPEEIMDKACIYIKPIEKKIYYVVPDKMSGEIEI